MAPLNLDRERGYLAKGRRGAYPVSPAVGVIDEVFGNVERFTS